MKIVLTNFSYFHQNDYAKYSYVYFKIYFKRKKERERERKFESKHITRVRI